MGWDSRLSWSGEQPAGDAVLLQRFHAQAGTGADRTAVDATGRDWTIVNWTAATAALTADRWGNRLTFNMNAPSSEQTSLRVPYFAGMWPSSGKVLLYTWAALRYAMTFTPIMSTRNTAGKAPLVYLSTMSDGRPRAQVYSAAGSLILDQSETLPWTATPAEWVCYMMLVDLDARTSQIALVRHTAGDKYVAPVRSFTAEPNLACEADLHALTLAPTASYWANGHVDEMGLWHPGADFNLEDFAEQVRLSTFARGSSATEGAGLDVTDAAVTATAAGAVLRTGAEPVNWDHGTPQVQPRDQITADPLAYLSDDGGATWTGPTAPGDLPATFAGIARWEIPLEQGETFTGLDLVEAQPVPTLDPIGPLDLEQRETVTIPITGEWIGAPTFQVVAASGVQASIASGDQLRITAGLTAGDARVTIAVTDETGQMSEPLVIAVTVHLLPWEPPENPVFAKAPLILHDDQEQRAAVLHNPAGAKLLREVNGEQTLTFSIPVKHPHAALLAPERAVEAAGDLYRIRRLTRGRKGGTPTVVAYCEARWYDLAFTGQVAETEWSGVQPGPVLEHILEGTGWAVGSVTVTTRRTWKMDKGSPLAALRQAAEVHGGDLIFDNHTRTVHLLAVAGKDRGVAFFHGRGLQDAERVEDTTSLVTRIEPRNAEGVGIESVNAGVPWLEDFSYTQEVRFARYEFASGTSPHTMLAMTQATLGKRARPAVSYQATVADLSAWTGQPLDRFDVGDRVLIIDEELGIETTQRIVAMEYDLLQPWASEVTLSEKLRELGSDSSTEAGVLTTGVDIDTRDLVPFNLLKNARFDNGLAHWAASGAQVVDGGATGTRSVRFEGAGTRWVEQTVAPDTRDAYTFSMQIDSAGGPTGWSPDVTVVAEITFTDGSTETINLDLV